MTEITAVFGRPFAQQVAAFRIRLVQLQGTANWKDVWQSEHDRAFMVAGAMKAELLADFAVAIDKAITKGTTLEEFRRDFAKAVEDHNWHGWTGEETEKGRAWRTRVIYKTNMATSYAAGRHAQLTAAEFAFWVYFHGGSREPRIQHLGWNGLILPADHPFWATHFPPNGWGCSCHVSGARSMAGAIRLGGNPALSLPDGWDAIDPRTGSPVGVGKGWAYAPGESVGRTVAALAEKPVHWDFSLATAYMRDIPEANRDLLSHSFRSQTALADRLTRFADQLQRAALDSRTAQVASLPPQLTLGLVPRRQMGQIESLTNYQTDGALFDFALDQDAVRHVFGRHGNEKIEMSRGQRVVSPKDFGKLGALLNAPDTIEIADDIPRRGPILRFTKVFGSERLVVFFELRKGRMRMQLVTMWVEKNVGASPTATP